VEEPARLGAADAVAQDREGAAPPEPFERLTLVRALHLAESFHPALAAARAEVEAAGGRALQAGLFPNPVAVARMESAPFEGSTTGEAEYPVGISQRVPLGRRLGAGARAGERDAAYLEKELEVRRLEVRSRVHGRFAAALYAARVAALRKEALQNGSSAVAAARARVAAGEAPAEEIPRAEMERLRVEGDLERARSLEEEALLELEAAVGAPDLRVGSVEGSLEEALEVPAIESLAARLAESPILEAAEADLEARRAHLELAEAQRVPDVNLDFFYRRLEASEEDAFDVGISVPLPVFDRNQGRIREVRANVAAAEARARTVRGEVAARLRVSVSRLSRAVAAARRLREEVLPRAALVLGAAEARYSGGDASLSDVLPVRRDHTAVQLEYLDALREVMESWAGIAGILRGT
jgi:cobalt-zinc-cadmium efflux system outer membrane protein